MLRIWNYGGGVQTIAIACLIRSGQLPAPDYAIFADTGDEPDEVYAWLEFMRPMLPCPLHVVKRDGPALWDDVIDRVSKGKRLDKPPLWTMGDDGREAPIGRDCTVTWKIKVIQKEIKRLLGIKPRGRWPNELAVEQWLGISADEITRMKTSTDRWMRWWHPLIEAEWTDGGFWRPQIRHPGISRKNCIEIIRASSLHEEWDSPTVDPPKSACRRCPYRSNAMWRHHRDTEPEAWKETIASDKALRQGPNGLILGMKRPVYLHRSLKPLDEVDLDEEVGSAMDNECAGICGV